jgi:uncharacterized membrane protein
VDRGKEWTAEITEQRPDERVAWKNTEGGDNSGVITFHRIGEGKAKVTDRSTPSQKVWRRQPAI